MQGTEALQLPSTSTLEDNESSTGSHQNRVYENHVAAPNCEFFVVHYGGGGSSPPSGNAGSMAPCI